MLRSTDRILTTHQGVLPHSPEVDALLQARARGESIDEQLLSTRLRASIADAVQKQVRAGLDSINDGELSKSNFTNYVRERLSGHEALPPKPDDAPNAGITGRDMKDFGEFITTHDFFGHPLPPRPADAPPPPPPTRVYATSPLKYTGHEAVQADIANFKAALQGVSVTEAYLPAITPGVIEHWMRNACYKSDEEFVYGIADALHEEYNAIADAGLTLQLDNPDLPDGWQMFPDMSVADYRKYAQLRVEALNHALRDIPEEQIRLHVCWGSGHHPHKYDIPLKEIVDIIFSVKAQSYSIEASNPSHEYEWTVFEDFKLPEGKVLIPGVVGHHSDFLEHPRLVAQRLVRYANLVGKENVVGGTDCGLGTRVGHPNIAWAKFASLAEGARLATKQLWGR